MVGSCIWYLALRGCEYDLDSFWIREFLVFAYVVLWKQMARFIYL